MASVIWTLPAVEDLDAIADYIALDNPDAAHRLVQKVFHAVGSLEKFPRLGSEPPELRHTPYRQLVISPCRVFYRITGKHVVIVHVYRGEQLIDEGDF